MSERETEAGQAGAEDATTALQDEVDQTSGISVPGKVRERLASSGLLEPGETVKVYIAGQGAISPLVPGILRLPFLMRDMRAFVLTDQHLYVFDMKWGGAGAVKSIRAKHPLGSTDTSLGEAKAGWRMLTVGDERMYVASHGRSLAWAQAIAAAGRAPARSSR